MANNTGYKDVLNNKEYFKYLAAAIINRLGDSIDAIASAWIVYELTSNAMWSAIIYGINKVPSVFIAPFAGAWVEGKKKKPIMIITDLIRAVCVAFIATGLLMGFLKAWMLVCVTFIISTAEAFRLPAGSSIMPKLLDKNELSYGLSLSSAMSTVTEIIGMAVAAGIIAIIGTAGAIYVDMGTFIVSALIISNINIPNDDIQAVNDSMKEYVKTLKMGFSYVLGNKVVLFLVLFAAFLNGILVPLNSLLAPLANEVIKGGAETLSIISISIMTGMLLGTIVYPNMSKKIKKEIFVIGCGLCIGIYYIAVILVSPAYSNVIFRYGFTVVACFLLGIFMSLLSAFLQVEFISLIDEQYLARASSIMNALGAAVTPVMSLIISVMAAYLSTHIIFVVTGVLDLFVCAYLIISRVLIDILYGPSNSVTPKYAE